MTDTKQPEALRLADAIDPPQIACLPETRAFAATELRRLHEVNAELLEALKDAVLIFTPAAKDSTAADVIDKARAAIAKAEVTV